MARMIMLKRFSEKYLENQIHKAFQTQSLEIH